MKELFYIIHCNNYLEAGIAYRLLCRKFDDYSRNGFVVNYEEHPEHFYVEYLINIRHRPAKIKIQFIDSHYKHIFKDLKDVFIHKTVREIFAFQ